MTLFPETLPPDKQPYPVPDNWMWVKLGEICRVVGGGTPSTSVKEYYEHGEIPWITPADLSGYEKMYIARGKRNITQLGLQNSSAQLLKKHSILLSSRAPIGYVAIAATELCTNQGFKSLEPSERLEPVYGYWYLKASTAMLEAMGSGTTFKEISAKKVAMIPVPLPPLPEQRRIAAKLDALFGKLREARTLIDEARESFALRRAAILHQAFSGKLTAQWRAEHPETASRSGELFDGDIEEKPYEITESWKWVKLKDIGEIVTGTTPSKKREDFYGNDVPLFKPTDLNQGYFVYQAQDNLSHLGSQEARILPEKSILVTCIGTIGKTGFSRRKGTTNQQINSIVPYAHIIPEYVYWGVNSHVFQQCMIDNACATTIAILNKSRFGNLAFPLAPLEEQREIVRRLDSLLGHESDAAGLLDMDDELDLLEQSILSRAFRGELGTNDPAESPAV